MIKPFVIIPILVGLLLGVLITVKSNYDKRAAKHADAFVGPSQCDWDRLGPID